MKKETIIAVFLGISFGAILGFFLISKNKEIQINKNKAIAPTGGVNIQNTNKDAVNFQALEISEPNDSSIVSSNSISIKGKVTRNSLIVVQSPIKDVVYKNDKEDFKMDFPLALGENVIKIVAYPQDKQLNIQEKNLNIYYLKEEL